MTRPPFTHYLNSDFDLSLRPRPRQLERGRIVRQVRELSVQGLLGVDRGDSVLIRAEVPQDFLAHLDGSGLPVPRLLRHPRIDPDTRLRPFGWNAEAIELNRRYAHPVAHPPLAVVRQVNSRSFALELEAELDSDETVGTVIESPSALDAFLARAPAQSAWVIKSEHGNAGLANRRLTAPALTPIDRRFVEDRLAEDDCLVVEAWRSRERDWGVVFDVPFDRAALHIHETSCTRDGAFIGAFFDPDADPAPWAEELTGMAEQVAARLKDVGYFGPVCVDAFSWQDGGRSRLRALVDLNCRRSMTNGAYHLWRRLLPDRTLCYRFFNRRRLRLPAELEAVLAALGRHRYDRSARRGILLVSPLQLGLGAETWRTGKLAFMFVADTRTAVAAQEQWFRRRFEA